jgi:hypothetical protein
MTPLLPELEAFPVEGVSDGELIAFSEGHPDFLASCDRMLLRSGLRIPVAFVAFADGVRPQRTAGLAIGGV